MQNRSHNEIPFYGHNKSQIRTSIDMDVEKLEHSHMAGSSVNGITASGNSLSFFKWLNTDLLYVAQFHPLVYFHEK